MNIESIISVLRLKPFDTSTSEGRSIDKNSEEKRSKERYRLILLGSFTNLFTKLITSVIGLISVPLTIGYLGKDLYGLWMVISSLVVWMQLSDFGIANGLINSLSEAYGKDDYLSVSSYIITAFLSLLILAIISIIPVIVISYYLPWEKILNIHDINLIKIAQSCFLVLGLFFLVNLPLSIIGNIYKSIQLSHISNNFQIISSSFSLIGLIISINMKLNIVGLIVIISFAPILTSIFLWLFFLKKTKWFILNKHLINKLALKRITQTSIPMFFFQIGALLINQITNIILVNIAGLKIVADYNILMKIYMLIFFVGNSIAYPFYPAIREAFERKDFSWVKKSIKRVIKLRIGIVMILSLPMIMFGDFLIKIWIKQSLEMNFGISGWLCFNGLIVIAALGSTYSEILTALDDIWSQIHVVFINAAIVICGIIVLTPILNLKGVFLSTILSASYPTYWGYRRLKKEGVFN